MDSNGLKMLSLLPKSDWCWTDKFVIIYNILTLYQVICFLFLDISKPPVLQKILILSAVISELLPRTATDFCYTCFLIPKFTFVVILYIMIGLFSIVLYVALFIDALLFIAFVILAVLKGRVKKGDDCFANWGKCMEIMFYTPFKIYKTLNKFFGINICQ